MRKSTQFLLLLFVMFLAGTAATAQTVITTQNFEGGSLPTGWTRSQNTPSRGFLFGTHSDLQSTYFTIPGHSKFACSNDDKYDDTSRVLNKADRDMLISPSMNFTTYSHVAVGFDGYFIGILDYANDKSTATVLATTNNGSTWDTVYSMNGSHSWQRIYVDLTAYAGQPNVKVAFKYADHNTWSFGFGVDNVVVFSPATVDAAMEAISAPEQVVVSNSTPAEFTLGGTIRALGTGSIGSGTINWTINGGAVQSQSFSSLHVPKFGTQDITLTQHVSLPTPGTYTISMWISDPNNTTDANSANDTVTTTVAAVGTLPHKNVLIEEATGAWCGWCVDGAYACDTIVAAHNDIIAVSLHNQDGMVTTEGNAIVSEYITGFPGGVIDRVPFGGSVMQDRGNWMIPDATSELQKTTPVSVGLLSSYNKTTRELKTMVVSKFFAGTTTKSYRVNIYICENDVTGPAGAAYDQHNYLYHASGYQASPYYTLPSVITGFHHMRVVRKMLGGSWGEAAVIPATVNTNDEFSKTYTFTLPSTWHDTSVFLVAMVQEYDANESDNRPILNCVKGGLNGFTQTPIVNSYATTGFDSLATGDSLLFHHGDTLNYTGGALVFQLGDTVVINGDTTVIDNIGQLIVVKPGDQVTVFGANGAGSTTIPNNHTYGILTYGTAQSVDFNASRPVGIANVGTATELLSVYPNPASNELNLAISLVKTGDVHITLTNMAGQQLKAIEAINLAANTNSIKFSTADLPAGVYMLNVRTANSSMTQKVVIAR